MIAEWLEPFLISINDAMRDSFWTAQVGCFFWGLVSTLLSPCHMASIPLLVSYAAGQKMTVRPKDAISYAVLFSIGLFVSIALIGALCAFLGAMLGEVPRFVYVLVGCFLIVMGLRTFTRYHCDIYFAPLFRLSPGGLFGAFLLGLVYGFLSGVCTFGFLAPVLATIFVEHKLLQGILMSMSFGAGHCLPIAVIGSGVSLLDTKGYQRASGGLKKLAACLVILFGVYFLCSPFL